MNISKGIPENNAIYLNYIEGLETQEYKVDISESQVCLQASTDCGMLYAIQTLRQIIRQEGLVIPCLEITDYPQIKNRGLYYDVTRCRIPTLDYMKKLVDTLSFYKINQLHLYIEHTYMFKRLSEVWRDDTPLTSNEILELDAYCQERNVELVPSIAAFGHLYKVLRTKTYRSLSEREELCDDSFSFVDRMEHHTLDVSNEESFQFVTSLIEEYMPLFKSDKFNICGDETFDLGKGKSEKLADTIGEQEMYVQYIKRLCEYLVERGKTPMFWGDIICESPDAIKKLPEKTICLNWGYSANVDEVNTEKLAKAGARLYNCPGVSGWNQFVNQVEVSYENIRRMCAYGIKYGVEGILNTDWGDYGHVNHPDMAMTGIIYGAAFSWNKDIPEFDDINQQISVVQYGDRKEAFVKIVSNISTLWKYKWEDLVWFKEKEKNEWDESSILELKQALSDLKSKKKELQEYVAKMNGHKKEIIRPYLIAVDGMILLQRIGIALSGHKQDASLAESIEKWFYYYKTEWRKVSREAELFHIQEVICWIADYLRSIENKKESDF